jgi:hypothetical protein
MPREDLRVYWIFVIFPCLVHEPPVMGESFVVGILVEGIACLITVFIKQVPTVSISLRLVTECMA